MGLDGALFVLLAAMITEADKGSSNHETEKDRCPPEWMGALLARLDVDAKLWAERRGSEARSDASVELSPDVDDGNLELRLCRTGEAIRSALIRHDGSGGGSCSLWWLGDSSTSARRQLSGLLERIKAYSRPLPWQPRLMVDFKFVANHDASKGSPFPLKAFRHLLRQDSLPPLSTGHLCPSPRKALLHQPAIFSDAGDDKSNHDEDIYYDCIMSALASAVHALNGSRSTAIFCHHPSWPTLARQLLGAVPVPTDHLAAGLIPTRQQPSPVACIDFFDGEKAWKLLKSLASAAACAESEV